MYARVVTIHVRRDQIDECVRIFKEINAPSIASHPGFDHGHWWLDRETGKATSVTFWDTADHERGSRANIPRLIDGMAHVLSSHDVEQESFERVHDAYAARSPEAHARPVRACAPNSTTSGEIRTPVQSGS